MEELLYDDYIEFEGNWSDDEKATGILSPADKDLVSPGDSKSENSADNSIYVTPAQIKEC